MDQERQYLVDSLGFGDTFAFFQTKPAKDWLDLNTLRYCLSWSLHSTSWTTSTLRAWMSLV